MTLGLQWMRNKFYEKALDRFIIVCFNLKLNGNENP